MEDDVVAGGDLTDAATMIAEERSHGVPVLRRHTKHKATRRFVDKRSERIESVERHHHRHAEPRAIAISLTATARPPSLQSWAAVTLPSQIAAWIAR